VLTKSLTIVLPVHNAESRLRKNVDELLELASELTAKFGVLIIDDGSTDSTFEVAAELAAHFPQVKVHRHRQCRGLGAAIDYAQRRVRSDAVILHDGVTPINSQQVRELWCRWVDQANAAEKEAARSANRHACGSDFANLAAIHSAMEQAHRRIVGFQLITPLTEQLETEPMTAYAHRSSSPKADMPRQGVGTIPALPRPKFLSVLASFALGE